MGIALFTMMVALIIIHIGLIWEYSFVDIVILLYLIIKLSSYKFSPKINWNIVALKIAKKILLAILLLIKYITRIVVN